jgi:hypothetical protein
MPRHEIRITSAGLDALLNDLAALPPEPDGSHIEEEELLLLAVDALPDTRRDAVFAHLAACVECLNSSEAYVEAAQPWLGAAGERRIASLRNRRASSSSDWSRARRFADDLRKFLAAWQFAPATPALATRGSISGRGRGRAATPFSARLEQEPDGALTLRVLVAAKELAGYVVVVSIREREWRAPLLATSPRSRQLQAVVRFEASDKELLSSASEVHVGLNEPDA